MSVTGYRVGIFASVVIGLLVGALHVQAQKYELALVAVWVGILCAWILSVLLIKERQHNISKNRAYKGSLE